ncbi:nucleotidyltransferase family protein [Halomonas sp. MCCC 1A11062]|uniref:nucleotidyltransferase family protein n=1 Tax=Halomonas sp. MCCC 1A11062 TaxID=2733485 RepID=UPI001F2F2016|nr:nucleotidyltransferase family protein [Halomonas sp. MCCC 1A11062]MCE8039188.1 nucleotidyltransferase family protein [Halomonas sp. MCCC 1A11062]
MKEKLIEWIRSDHYRMAALEAASRLQLKDWCLAAGFVRNLAWDRLHGYVQPTPLSDIDLVYFDRAYASAERDEALEARLHTMSSHPWSVKNQARMHTRNGDPPYSSTAQAMSHWVEVETAVGVTFDREADELKLVAPFGVRPLFEKTITMNAKRRKPKEFAARIRDKGWQRTWPQLTVIYDS